MTICRGRSPTCAFVVTTTNKRALDDLVGPSPAVEIIGKPFDLDEAGAAVRRALARRHTSPTVASGRPV